MGVCVNILRNVMVFVGVNSSLRLRYLKGEVGLGLKEMFYCLIKGFV